MSMFDLSSVQLYRNEMRGRKKKQERVEKKMIHNNVPNCYLSLLRDDLLCFLHSPVILSLARITTIDRHLILPNRLLLDVSLYNKSESHLLKKESGDKT